MITISYSFTTKNRMHDTLMCGYCGKHLGSYDIEDGKEYNDIEGWIYCPYCGRELEDDMDIK